MGGNGCEQTTSQSQQEHCVWVHDVDGFQQDEKEQEEERTNKQTKQIKQTMAMPVLLMAMMRARVETTQLHRHEPFGVAFLWTAGRDVGWTVLSLSLVVVLSPEKKAQTDGPNDCLHQLANRPVRLSCPSCPSFSLFLLSHLLRRPVTQSIRQPASHIGFLHLTSLSAVRMDWHCQILSFFFIRTCNENHKN